MTSTYDSTGIVLDRFAQIKTRLETLAVAQWGESVDLSEDEILGHKISNISLLLAEINEVLQDVYDALSIANATGVHLDNLVALIGLARSQAAYSTVTLTLTASLATTVPAGTQYRTAAGVTFATDVALVFSSAGTGTVAATCTVAGPFNAAIGEVTTIVNPINGITACTNASAAIPGRYRQDDAEVKEAHTLATATSGNDDVGSIYEALNATTGVSGIYILDNDTELTAADGTPAHNIHVSVIGGSDADVAGAIDANKTSGVPTYGSQSVDVYDDVLGQTKEIHFDRAVEVPIHIIVTGTAISGLFPDDGATQIKNYLIAHFEDFRINDDVIFTALYKPIYTCPGFVCTSLLIGTSDPPAGTSDIAITALQKATLIAANIDVTVN